MAETSMPFDGTSYASADIAALNNSLASNGKRAGYLNQYTVTNPSGMTLRVASGGGWVQGYRHDSTSTVDFTLANGDASNPRIDTLVLRLNLTGSAISGQADKTVKLAILQGTPAGSPVAPSLTQTTTRYELPLWDITVPATATTLAGATYTDRRVDAVNYTLAVPAFTLGTANAAGVASTLVRSDATLLAFDATVPSTQAFADAAAVGAATVAARRDHKHAMPTIVLANLPAITQMQQAAGSTSNPTTTSTTYVDMTDMSVSITTVGTTYLIVRLNADVYNSAGGNNITLAVTLDGAAEVGVRDVTSPAAGYAYSGCVDYVFTGVAAGAHTVKGRWKTAAGTATANTTERILTVQEVRA